MQEEVRIALQNLKGIYDDGFMTKAEYESRRKALIDGATQLAAGKPRQTATAHTRASAAASKSSSVFSRLGEKMEEGKWGHEGFSELYGAPQKGKANIKQKVRFTRLFEVRDQPLQRCALHHCVFKKSRLNVPCPWVSRRAR
eukprot:143533-Pleurochrysis_carterae.AAC.2